MVRHRTKYSGKPREGTKSRVIYDAMMRPCGMRSNGDGFTSREINNYLSRFRDDLGLDIRVIGSVSCKPKPMTRIYRIVGKNNWDGSYTSYIEPNEYENLW